MSTLPLRLRPLRQACRWRYAPIIPIRMLIPGMVFLLTVSTARAQSWDGGGVNDNLSMARTGLQTGILASMRTRSSAARSG